MKELALIALLIALLIGGSKLYRYTITDVDGNLVLDGRVCCQHCFQPIVSVGPDRRCNNCRQPIPCNNCGPAVTPHKPEDFE
jgi:hypothetical protein